MLLSHLCHGKPPFRILVDQVGLEPTTPCVQNRRSPLELLAHKLYFNLGRDRRFELLFRVPQARASTPRPIPPHLEHRGSIELPTGGLRNRCSPKLSYRCQNFFHHGFRADSGAAAARSFCTCAASAVARNSGGTGGIRSAGIHAETMSEG